MRRISWISAGPILVLAVLVGCRDGIVSSATSPLAEPSVAVPAPMSLAPQGAPTLSLTGALADSASVDFSVGPNGGVYYAGNHAVVFPAQSICDPATSSYGPGTWDQPCSPLQSTLKVHAEVRSANGQTWVDFSPSLRFAPSSNPAKWVWIVMYAPGAIGATTSVSNFNILWASAIGGTTVDETPTDSTLRTYVDTWQGLALRRIKHFSGYTLPDGRTCDPAAESCDTTTPSP
jgi:hypothetical protein